MLGGKEQGLIIVVEEASGKDDGKRKQPWWTKHVDWGREVKK